MLEEQGVPDGAGAYICPDCRQQLIGPFVRNGVSQLRHREPGNPTCPRAVDDAPELDSVEENGGL